MGWGGRGAEQLRPGGVTSGWTGSAATRPPHPLVTPPGQPSLFVTPPPLPVHRHLIPSSHLSPRLTRQPGSSHFSGWHRSAGEPAGGGIQGVGGRDGTVYSGSWRTRGGLTGWRAEQRPGGVDGERSDPTRIPLGRAGRCAPRSSPHPWSPHPWSPHPWSPHPWSPHPWSPRTQKHPIAAHSGVVVAGDSERARAGGQGAFLRWLMRVRGWWSPYYDDDYLHSPNYNNNNNDDDDDSRWTRGWTTSTRRSVRGCRIRGRLKSGC